MKKLSSIKCSHLACELRSLLAVRGERYNYTISTLKEYIKNKGYSPEPDGLIRSSYNHALVVDEYNHRLNLSEPYSEKLKPIGFKLINGRMYQRR